MKVAFFDRDGTINKDYEDDKWSIQENPEIIDGVINLMRKLIDRNYKIIIITNQYLINENFISQEQYFNFTFKLIKLLEIHGIQILDIFYCPHSRSENCNCRKPRDGLIQQALDKYNDINLNESIFIGNSIEDYRLAQLRKIKFYGYNLCFNYDNEYINNFYEYDQMIKFIEKKEVDL